MGKKQKDEAPDARSAANRDIIQRLNFLYQAGAYMQELFSNKTPQDGSSNDPTKSMEREFDTKKKSQKPKKKSKTTNDLGSVYVNAMKIVSQKSVVKIDPSVKRTICKGCSSILIPGTNMTVRVKKSSSHRHAMVYTCLNCKYQRRIPAPPILLDDTPISSGVERSNPATQNTSEIIPTLSSNSGIKKRNRGVSSSGPLPLSARPDAGHVVFCGNVKLEEDHLSGNGVYVA